MVVGSRLGAPVPSSPEEEILFDCTAQEADGRIVLLSTVSTAKEENEWLEKTGSENCGTGI